MKNYQLKFFVQLLVIVLVFTACSSSDNSPEEPIQATCLKIGDAYQGGIIFYIDQTNEHGLIAAKQDQSNGAIWGCPEATEPIANQRDIGFGSTNTTAIVNNCPEENTAAKICEALSIDGFEDWFLPTTHELELLYHYKNIVGGFTNKKYSSSTEAEYSGNNFIYVLTIDFGINPDHADRQEYVIKTTPLPVRAIRKF